jgi:hypothetical protein
MTSTLTAQQRLKSFDELEISLIELSCEYSMVHIDELLGGSRKKEVANVRSVICVILREYGYTYQSISDILDVNIKISHTYFQSHGNRMADIKYSTLYNRVKRALSSSDGRSENDLRTEVNRLKVSVAKINERLNHIHQLLTGE